MQWTIYDSLRHCHNLISGDFQLRNLEEEVWFEQSYPNGLSVPKAFEKACRIETGINTDISYGEDFRVQWYMMNVWAPQRLGTWEIIHRTWRITP